jgi:YD repeat-containing protein
MRRELSILLLIIPLFAAIATPRADAQNSYLYGTGNPTWGVNIPIEDGFINVANGNVHIEIPVASEPQRGGSSYTESVIYDSRIWQIVNSGSSYGFQPNGGGWTFGGTLNGGQVEEGSLVNGSVPCSGSGGSQGYLQTTYTWIDPSGTTHLFAPPIYSLYAPICPYGNTGGISNSTTGTAYAVDGSGYYLNVSQATSGPYNGATFPVVFDQEGNQPGYEDRNGNYTGAVYNHISASGSSPSEDVWTWNDTKGNTALTETNTTGFPPNFGGSTYYAGPTYLDVLTIGGATKRYTVNWENINVHTAFGQSDVGDTSTTIAVVQSLTLPDGSSYTFTYDSGTSSGNYGELQSMTLPTGATINFGYQNYQDSYQNLNRWVTSYSGGDGSYTFAPSVVSNCSGQTSVGCQESMTVTDGNSNQVVYLLTLNNGAWNTQMDYYNNLSGTLSHVMSTATNNNFQNSCPTNICGGGAQWITASSTTTTLSDTGQTAKTQSVYNNPQYGKPDKVQSWDYYTGSPSATPTKETDYTYGYFVNGAAYPTKITQLDSGGNVAAQTSYYYDQGTPTATSGLPDHSTNFVGIDYLSGTVITLPQGAIGNRGNLTSVVSGVGTTVTTSSTYDDAGTKLSDTDANSNQTTYTAMCSDAYPSGVTYPMKVNGTSLQSSAVSDCSSGLVTSTQDLNGQTTVYSYFTSGTNIGRLQTVTRPDLGSTAYAYPSTMEVDQTVAQSSSVNMKQESILDAYGRSYQSLTVAPEGSISSETTYDATGRPYSVTTPHLAGTSSSTDGTTYRYYDVLGRTTKVIAPDGSTTTSTYSGNTQTVTDALSHNRQYTYDAFHRLTSVLEPNSSGSLTNETDYQYNATVSPPVYRTTEVDQWGGAKNSTSPGDRQRTMNYDSLGRLISSTSPETGTVTYSYLASGSLCAGNVTLPCSKTDARGVTTQYTYDALNRMTSKSYSSDASGTPRSCFQYDTSAVPGAGGNLLGRLTNQWTQHASAGACSTSILTTGGYLTLRATLAFDSMGRPTSVRQCTPSNCTGGTPYAGSYGYDLAGELTSYSNGLSSTPGAGTSPLTFTQSFDGIGRLQTVTSTWSDGTHPATLFSASAYAPPGALTNATYGNGVSLTRNFNGQLLPTSEIDTINGAAAATSGSATVTITGTEQSK